MAPDHLKLRNFEHWARPAIEDLSDLQLTVIFTTIPDTIKALRQAMRLAVELNASIRILVAQTVPYPLPLDQPRVTPDFRTRQFQALWKEEAVETWIDVRLCRDVSCCVLETLTPGSLVVIGARRRIWPFSRDMKLARALRRAGHEVITVPLVQTRRMWHYPQGDRHGQIPENSFRFGGVGRCDGCSGNGESTQCR